MDRDEQIKRDSRAAYEEVRLPRSLGKSLDKQSKFSARGAEVDNRSGRVGPPVEKIHSICVALFQLLQLPFLTKKTMQQATGLCVHPFMRRRELMAVFHNVFAWVDSIENNSVRTIPPAVRDEIIATILVLPLLISNVR